MTETVFPVAKESGTYADVFTAAGLAELLASSADGGKVRIVESPARFDVAVDGVLDPVEGVAQWPGYPYLQAKTEAVPSVVSDRVSYQDEKKRVAAFAEARTASRAPGAQANDANLLQIMEANKPRDDWRLLQVLNVLQGFRNTNKVHELLLRMDHARFQADVSRAIHALATGVPSGLDWKTSSVQIFNPNAAKGYGLLKPSGTDRNNRTKEQWTDSFVEWLRYRGYFATACPFFMGSRGEHIRILVPMPADISVAALRAVAAELRQAPLYGSGPKLDARATLELARILIERSEFGDTSGPLTDAARVFLKDRTPARVVSGLAITHFQSLGSARAVSELATLAVPDWFDIHNSEDASAWLQILDEHRRVVSALRDNRSDEMGFLIRYRSFLARRGRAAVDALLDIMGAYGAYLPGARDRGRRLPSFSAQHLHRIVEGMMVDDYLAILDDPGFQAVASAIRRSTVSAQSLKAQRQDHREIRYDLLHEIRRKRSLPTEAPLLEALSDFVASYNYENARRRERGKRAPRNVTTEEFVGLTRLMQHHGASLMGAMLAAYGSCRVAAAAQASTADSDEDVEIIEPTAGETEEEE